MSINSIHKHQITDRGATKTKTSRSYILIAILLLALTMTDLAALAYPERFGYGPALVAVDLTETPGEYIPLTNPDSYMLRAIQNPGNLVFIGSFQNTQFDEMFQTYGTENVEFNGNYYQIGILYADAFAYATFFWLLIVSWGILTVSIIIRFIRKQPPMQRQDFFTFYLRKSQTFLRYRKTAS